MLIDKERLIELYGDIQAAKPLIELFNSKANELIRDIEQAVMLEHEQQLDAICHRLIGQARYIGSPQLEKLATQIRDETSIKKITTLNELKATIRELSNVQL